MDEAELEDAVLEECVLHGQELSPLQCLGNADFWLLFFTCAIGARA